ncbi:S-layer homology domain-containing protein [Oscillibacter hominis]|uniref:S-layer homology domain-containing protein n=1 Tax=Oscillibacter hominis TaxID=2763056 RepID=A0A7G9B196_9FIRM|nr:S-layer homology domain-containing protein [Oscillibacter hominis]QNL43327.1 S-layer homology domain-containing protein [Oscillibacter hominis]
MKKRALAPIAFLAAACCILAALASGGDSSDPLVSLSYLNGTFTDKVNSAVDARLNASGQGSAGTYASSTQEIRLKEGDVLCGSTGTDCMLLAGSMKVTFPSGAVVDITAGKEMPSGTALTANHRYLVAEDTAASFTVTSKTAVLHYEGPYRFTLSDSVDYNAIASALKTLHLFKGSYTGYGSGFDLEMAPTRIQALIMFIRVLGEEEAALSYTGPIPFTDIARGSLSEHYVSYAYSKGYTNGFTATLFQPDQAISANQYMEFLLRALGYSSSANTDLSATMATARSAGVLTDAEVSMLQSGTFLRAQLVYVSYYALDASLSDGSGTLEQKLMDSGVFTSDELLSARAMITGGRIF